MKLFQPFKLFLLSLRSLVKDDFFSIIAKCVALSLIIIIGGVYGITMISDKLINFEYAWLDWTLIPLISVLLSIGGWFLFPSLMILIASLFQNSIIRRVAIHNYKEEYDELVQNSGRNKNWIKESTGDLVHSLRFTMIALSLNLAVLPFSLLGFGLLLNVALNSFLLGREYFEGTAGEFVHRSKFKEIISSNKLFVYGGGLLITLCGTIPIVNLIAAPLGYVYMSHGLFLLKKEQKI